MFAALVLIVCMCMWETITLHHGKRLARWIVNRIIVSLQKTFFEIGRYPRFLLLYMKRLFCSYRVLFNTNILAEGITVSRIICFDATIFTLSFRFECDFVYNKKKNAFPKIEHLSSEIVFGKTKKKTVYQQFDLLKWCAQQTQQLKISQSHLKR